MVDTVHLKTSACKMFIRMLRAGVGKHLRLARFGGPGKLLGYAIREIYAGTTTPTARFTMLFGTRQTRSSPRRTAPFL